MLLLGGRIVDLQARRLIFTGGLMLITAASAFNGAARNHTSLIVGRAVQGLGAALLVPAALSLLVTTFPEGRERNLARGAWSAASAAGGSFGLLLGGVLTQTREWRRERHERAARQSASSRPVDAETCTRDAHFGITGIPFK